MSSRVKGRLDPPWLAIAGLMLASATLLTIAQSQVTFFFDDWYFLVERRGSSVDTFLDPANEHLAPLPIAIYNGLLEVFGMASPRPMQVVSNLLLLVCGALLFVYVRRRVGDWLAVMAAALILFFGAAWLDLLWFLFLAVHGACAAGIGAFLALDRDDRRGDLAAAALLTVSVAFWEIGIAFAVGAFVAVILGSRPWPQRLYIPLLPMLLYAAWWAGWGYQADSSLDLGNVVDSPLYVFDAVSQGLAALLGLGTPLSGDSSELVGLTWGRILVGAAIVLAILRLRGKPIPNGLWVALAAGGTYWLLAAFTESELRPPTSARILLPSGVFILMIAAEVMRGVRPSRPVLLVAAGITAIALSSGQVAFRDGTQVFETTSESVRAQLAAIERTKEANPSFVLEGWPWLLPLATGDYLAAVDDYGGTPAYGESELLSAPTPARAAADSVFAAALGMQMEFTPPGEQPASDSEPGCSTVRASPEGGTEIEFGPGRVDLAGSGAVGTRVLLARYSVDAYSVELGTLTQEPVTFQVPADLSSQPWLLGLKGQGDVLVCVRPG